ncbi:MAG: sensor histidine kinase [Burkholderiaceae bacterium]|nr:MAG: sensor histidine kinase [Burkholderiaceae bacterium]
MNPSNTGSPTELVQARSLFGEILDWMLAPLLLLWPISIAFTYLVAQSIASAPFDRALDDDITLLARQLMRVNSPAELMVNAQPQEILRASDTDQLFYQILDPQGRILAGNRDFPPPPKQTHGQSVRRVQFRSDLVEGEPVRVAYRTLDHAYPGGSEITIQVAETLTKREQLANEIIKGVILPQFFILPLAVILVWFALIQGIAPLKRLQQKILARRSDDLSPIPANEAPEEVTPLVLAFNELLQRQGRVIEQQRRFVADAAHQMRTPLTGLRTQAELALRQTDPQEIETSLRHLITSTKQATRLINQLLTMARTESQLTPSEALPQLTLDRLVRDVVHDWVPQALQKPIDLGLEIDGKQMMVYGHTLLLRELLNNLLDNALRYTPEQGNITVRLHRHDPGMITLEVEDTGPGIPPEERELIFERFYRVLGTGIDGSGLGLAIVKEIAQRHNAILTVHNNPRSTDSRYPGTLFRIAFPSLEQPATLEEP